MSNPSAFLLLKEMERFEIENQRKPQDAYMNYKQFQQLVPLVSIKDHNIVLFGLNIWPTLKDDEAIKVK